MVEKCMALSYDNLKLALRNLSWMNKEIYLELLNHPAIKRKLINSSKKYDFIWFVQGESDETILTLLSGDGMNVLAHTDFLIDKLNALLTCGKPYVNQLFLDSRFCSLVLANERELSTYFYSIKEAGAISFIEYMKAAGVEEEKIEFFIVRLSDTVMAEVMKKTMLSPSITKTVLTRGSKEAIEYLLNADPRITSLEEYSFDQIYRMAQTGVHIPPHLLEEKSFFRKITHLLSVKDYRFLITELSHHNDITLLEEKRKLYYDKMIDSYDEKENMTVFYKAFYEKVIAALKAGKSTSMMILEVEDYLTPFGSNKKDYEKRMELCTLYEEKDIDAIHRYFERESNLFLTDIIIDYHFEDLPYNFFLDLKQLCHFQMTEGRTLSREDIKLYQKLLDLDSLSFIEKKELHEQLKQKDFVSKYYDDFRKAKEKASTLMKEQMLTREKAISKKDEELSKRAGVDIYVLDGDPFCAFVKSLAVPKTQVLTKGNIFYSVDAGSYSLDGSSKLNTFNNPRVYYNIVFQDFPIDQVMHVYPVDSFSKYVRGYRGGATRRVYHLMTPEELVKKGYQYNEIVLMQRNDTRKENDELNSRLEVPSMFAIYCYDEITDNDVLSAKNLGLSIVLVKTKSYRKSSERGRINMNDTIGSVNAYQEGIDYITDITQDEQYGRRK